ncbi:MAG TPA: hypothetical protein PLP86_04850 [Armatimonadota bacterium]|nr:hypothetical protein [Armatimonadota bacterium]
MKRNLHYLCIVTLVLYCLLSVVCAQAQFITQWAEENSDKLGLTPDQKTRIEAIQKDLEKQYRNVLDDSEFNSNERKTKFREIQESERARVNEILTPAQQRKLKDLMYPKQQWTVSAYITSGSDLAHYTVRFEGYPSKYLSYEIRKQDIELNVFDAQGKPVSDGPQLTLAPDVPDVIKPTIDEDGISMCQVEFILDRKTAKPGFYTIQFKAGVNAVDAETNERVSLKDAVGSLRVYLTPQPDEVPALRPGQRFIGTPWEQVSASTVTLYRDVKSNKPISWGEIATKIVTLKRVEPLDVGHRLIFELEKHAGQIYLETENQAPDLPYLTPLLTEPVVRALKSRYEGKQVWCYGGPGAQCVSAEPGMAISLSGRVDMPLRISRIERVYMPRMELAVGNATFIGGERESAFITDNPLVVILDAPDKGLEFSALSYVGNNDPEEAAIELVSNPRAHCLGLWNVVSDSWDFERQYSLSNPFETHSTWPEKMREAVLSGKVVNGMTYEMVAWAIGWPSIYGTKSEMLALDDWAYDNIPFQGHVYFKDSLVINQEWPHLP